MNLSPNNETLYMASDFFVYEVDFGTIAAAGSATSNFAVQADSDFYLTKLTAMATDAADAPISSATPINASLLVLDTGSGRNLMNQAVPLANFFGNGQLPFILPQMRFFAARAVVSLTLTNNHTAAYNSVKLSFIGLKAFRRN